MPPSAVIGIDGKPLDVAGPKPRPEADRELLDGRGMLVPHVRTFNALYNAFSKVYSSRWDEAVRHGRQNAAAMLHDAFFRSLLQERFKPLERWKWEVEADPDELPANGKDPYENDREEVRRQLEAVVRRTRQLSHLRYLLGWGAGWFGRYGGQLRYDNESVGGVPRKVVGWWDPVDGDKLHATWEGQWGVMIRPGPVPPGYTVKMFDNVGPVILLDRPELRQRFVVHAHAVEDASYLDPTAAGRRYGVGLRDFAYWAWWLRDEMLSWLCDFMEKVGSLGLLLFWYQEGNPASKLAAEAAAKDTKGKNALAVPIPKGGDRKTANVELLPANMAGVQFLKEVVGDYFERHIERLFVGQSMSAGADDESGMGGTGRAEFAKDTKFNLLASDAENQSATLTTDLLLPLQSLNFRDAPWRFRWVYRVPDPTAPNRLEAWAKVKDVLPVKADELREVVGFSRPDEGDDVVGGPQAAAELAALKDPPVAGPPPKD